MAVMTSFVKAPWTQLALAFRNWHRSNSVGYISGLGLLKVISLIHLLPAFGQILNLTCVWVCSNGTLILSQEILPEIQHEKHGKLTMSHKRITKNENERRFPRHLHCYLKLHENCFKLSVESNSVNVWLLRSSVISWSISRQIFNQAIRSRFSALLAGCVSSVFFNWLNLVCLFVLFIRANWNHSYIWLGRIVCEFQVMIRDAPFSTLSLDERRIWRKHQSTNKWNHCQENKYSQQFLPNS